MLGTVGIAFALLITAVELSKEDEKPTYDLGLSRSSPEYLLFLAVGEGMQGWLPVSTFTSVSRGSLSNK